MCFRFWNFFEKNVNFFEHRSTKCLLGRLLKNWKNSDFLEFGHQIQIFWFWIIWILADTFFHMLWGGTNFFPYEDSIEKTDHIDIWGGFEHINSANFVQRGNQKLWLGALESWDIGDEVRKKSSQKFHLSVEKIQFKNGSTAKWRKRWVSIVKYKGSLCILL